MEVSLKHKLCAKCNNYYLKRGRGPGPASCYTCQDEANSGRTCKHCGDTTEKRRGIPVCQTCRNANTRLHNTRPRPERVRPKREQQQPKPRDYKAERAAARQAKGLPVESDRALRMFLRTARPETFARWVASNRDRFRGVRRRKKDLRERPWLVASSRSEYQRLRKQSDMEFARYQRDRKRAYLEAKARDEGRDFVPMQEMIARANGPEGAVRRRLKNALKCKKRGIGKDIRRALRGKGTIADWLGYDAKKLKIHLERQFTDGMNWEAFHRGEIHIDHIRPLRMFNLSDADQLKEAWGLTNLCPLWARDNIRKGGAVIYLI